MKPTIRAGLIAAAALLAGTAWAHHAIQAQFDFEKPVQVTGILSKVEWINPHAYFTIDVSEGGQVTTWKFETFGPGGLRKAGFSRVGFFKTGETYTVNGFGSKDNSKSGWVKDLKGPDGKVITIWYGDLNDRR